MVLPSRNNNDAYDEPDDITYDSRGTVKKSNNLSLADALTNIKHHDVNASNGDNANKEPSLSSKLDIPDSAYNIPVEENSIPHLIAVIAMIILPLIMIVGSFIADGLKAFVNPRMLFIIPVVIILWFAAKWTDDMGRIDVTEVEKLYPDIVIINPEEGNGPSRPKYINIRMSDDSTSDFTVVMKDDWEANMAFRRQTASFIMKNGKAAII